MRKAGPSLHWPGLAERMLLRETASLSLLTPSSETKSTYCSSWVMVALLPTKPVCKSRPCRAGFANCGSNRHFASENITPAQMSCTYSLCFRSVKLHLSLSFTCKNASLFLSDFKICFAEIQKWTLMRGSVGLWTKEYSVFLEKTMASTGLWGLNCQAPRTKRAFQTLTLQNWLLLPYFNMRCCTVTCTWLGRKRTAGSPVLDLIPMTDGPQGWAALWIIAQPAGKKKKQQYSKWLFFTPIRPVNVLKKWLQKASNKWIHFRGKWFGSLFITALWKWNQFYVSLRSKCLLRRQIYGLEPLVNQNILTFHCNTLNTHSLLLSEQLQDSYRWCGVSLIPSSKHVLTALWKLWRAFIEYRLEKTYCRIENAHLCCLSSASAGLAGHHACFHRAEPSQLRVCSHLDKGVGVPNCCKTITKALP